MSNEVITIEHDQKRSTQVAAVNPMQLIQAAVESGADIEKLERLMLLQDRWEASNAKKAFDEAMSEFQALMPVVPMRGNVDYTTNKGRTAYSYGKMEDAARIADPILGKLGLSYRFSQETEQNGNIRVTCIVSHKAGHKEENSLSAMPDGSGGKDQLKAMASTVSYLRRYTMTGGLGIVFSGEDAEGIFDHESTFINDQQWGDLYKALCNDDGTWTEKGAKIATVLKIDQLSEVSQSVYDRAMKMAGKK